MSNRYASKRSISLLNRAFSTQVAPASASSSSSFSGILSWLGLGSSRPQVSMKDSFPGIVEPPPSSFPTSPALTEITKLSNGIRIASENTWGPTSCIAVAISSGSQDENPEISGVTHLMEYMAFKATKNRTHFRMMQELTGFGASISASSSREQMFYSLDCLRVDLPAALEILCDSIYNPRFNPWEVNEIKAFLIEDLKGLKKNPQSLLGELLVSSAYSGGLGHPLITSEIAIEKLTVENLKNFHHENYTAPRSVLAVAGVGHQELLSWVEPMLNELPDAPKYDPPFSEYIGGEIRQLENDKLVHLVLAFDSQGGWLDLKSAATMTVLLYLMGGGGSFSSGGPGKGMHSRLYQNVLTKYHWIQNFTVINQAFENRCLTGVYAAAPGEMANKLVDIMCNEMQTLSTTIGLEELERAKCAAIGQVLMTLENKSVAAEDMARQILTYGHRKSAEVFIEAMRKITARDVTQIVAEMLKSPVSLACMGNITHVPRYAEISKRFG